ncbi:MAG: 50S ribosomal protein L1, partial [Dolichospermum sp.]
MVKKVSRRLRALLEKVEDRDYTPLEGLALLKETATAK